MSTGLLQFDDAVPSWFLAIIVNFDDDDYGVDGTDNDSNDNDPQSLHIQSIHFCLVFPQSKIC